MGKIEKMKTYTVSQFEGFIIEIGEKFFTTRLVDMISGDADSEAEFALEDFPEAEREKIILGRKFSYKIESKHLLKFK